MATLNAVVTTKSQTFASGTVEGKYTFTLTGMGLESHVETESTSALFPDVPPGSYTITVAKMGFSASATVEVPGDVSYQVPNTLTVTLG